MCCTNCYTSMHLYAHAQARACRRCRGQVHFHASEHCVAGAPAASGGGGLFGQVQQPQQQQAGGLFGQQNRASVPSLFGSAPSAFGTAAPAPASPFGQPQQQTSPGPSPLATQNLVGQFGYDTDGQGSRTTPFIPKCVKQGDSSEQFRSISAMPQYQTKSQEEIRLEDYQANVKGKPGAQLFPAVHPNKIPQPQQQTQPQGMTPCALPLSPLSLDATSMQTFAALPASKW